MNLIRILACFVSAASLALASTASRARQAPRFEPQTIDSKISIGYGLAIGDVDGDKKPDILLADKTQIVWYRNPDWKRFVMAENLTPHDNVCIAARDLDGDGKVEVAVGAQWNPGETSDLKESGAVFYLHRPADPTEKWDAIRLPHEPTTHRMKWVRVAGRRYSLVVVPLHGRGNKNGEGAGAKIIAYFKPEPPNVAWPSVVLDESQNMIHNFDVVPTPRSDTLLIGGKQGAVSIVPQGGTWAEKSAVKVEGVGLARGVGEIRQGKLGASRLIAAIEPMHGNELAVYVGDPPKRQLLTDKLAEGHALAVADLLKLGRDQVVVGWRNPNAEGKVGIRLYVPTDEAGEKWETHVIDDNTMACEDLAVTDLDGDGRLDIIASGRSTKNVVVYWNRTLKMADDGRKFAIGKTYPAINLDSANIKIKRSAKPACGRKALLVNFTDG